MTVTFNRLHLATRIHLALLRALGEGVDVSRMLRQRSYADEVLHICRGLYDMGLTDLADRFDDLTAAEDARAHMARSALEARAALARIPHRDAASVHPMGWAASTSGFGVTRAMADLAAAPARVSRFSPSGWLGLGRDRNAHH